jgi:glycine/sarcosine N-methyltransferase
MEYDAFSTDYDRFVDWLGRLAVEIPFLEKQLRKTRASQVLDAACGTGMHAIALAKIGFEVAGADLSAGMIERARANALASSKSVRFEVTGLGELSRTFGREAFEAVLCLGNSLPHLLTTRELASALKDFADCLRPGGLVLIQNRNFDAVMKKRDRWMEPQSAREGEVEWLFMRFYDFEVNGLLIFHVVILKREKRQGWEQSILTTRLRPLLAKEMKSALQKAGFDRISWYGDMKGASFDPLTSENLVVTARLAGK